MGIFQKMTGALGSAGKDVAKIAKDATDVSKCTAVIEESRAKIANAYTEIGKVYFQDHNENVDEKYSEFFETVQFNQEMIKNMEEKIRILKGIEVCKECGAELKKGANFCNICGARVEREMEMVEKQCKKCGALLKGDEHFCGKCGCPIEISEKREPEQTDIIICRECGKELKMGDAFCKYCGASVL